MRRWTVAEVVAAYIAGQNCDQIGSRFGISGNSINQAIHKIERRLKLQVMAWMKGLPYDCKDVFIEKGRALIVIYLYNGIDWDYGVEPFGAEVPLHLLRLDDDILKSLWPGPRLRVCHHRREDLALLLEEEIVYAPQYTRHPRPEMGSRYR